MFQGNWTCSKCGGAITQLPFEPRSNAGLTCRECYFKEKDGGAGSGGSSGGAHAPASDVDTGAGAELDDRDAPPFDPEGMGVASEPAPETPEMASAPVAEKKMFEGDWKCATCDGPITSLPFQPRDVTNLKCIDCFKKSRG